MVDPSRSGRVFGSPDNQCIKPADLAPQGVNRLHVFVSTSPSPGVQNRHQHPKKKIELTPENESLARIRLKAQIARDQLWFTKHAAEEPRIIDQYEARIEALKKKLTE